MFPLRDGIGMAAEQLRDVADTAMTQLLRFNRRVSSSVFLAERLVQFSHLRFDLDSVNVLHSKPPCELISSVYTFTEVVSEQFLGGGS